jgi:hypothetical protein
MALLRRRKKKPPKAGPTRRERWAQVKTAFSVTRKADSKMLPMVIATFVIVLALFVGVGVLVEHPVYASVFGVLFALIGTAAVFGRRVQRTAYSQVEGQLGAAAAVLQNMRGNWRVTPAVQFNKDQDMVHRVVGRPGVILVGEGSPNRLRGLVVNEKRALARLVGDTPIYDVVIGDGDGQVSLRELEKHFAKLPRNIKAATVNHLDGRLKAMRAASGIMPVPKGPMPTRVPRGKIR